MRGPIHRLRSVALAGLACLMASCALLVSYDGYRAGDDDGGTDAAERDAGDDAADARADARADAGANGCLGSVPGVYCGRSLPAYRGNVQDLVHCLGDGTMGAVDACDAGCASMPPGRQDACNACSGKPDALYCLHELVLDYPGNDVLIRCGAGMTTAASICTSPTRLRTRTPPRRPTAPSRRRPTCPT